MVEFAVEPLEVMWDEMVELGRLQWEESNGFGTYQPSFDRFQTYAKTGEYLPFAARHEGRLVGFCGVYLVPSMHTQNLMAIDDVWYLLPEYRKGWTAVSMLRFIEAECRKRGALEAMLTTPNHLKSGAICKRLKFEPVATVWRKFKAE